MILSALKICKGTNSTKYHIYMYIIGIEVLNVNIYRMMYTATIKRSAENDIDTYG